MRVTAWIAALCLSPLLATGCGGDGGSPIAPGGHEDAGAHGNAGTPSDAGMGEGLPCAVAGLLSSQCLSCHGDVLSQGVLDHLGSRAQLQAPARVDPTQTTAERALARMRAVAGGMPPAPNPRVSDANVAAFQAWIQAGLPAGSCAADGGQPQDGGVRDGGAVDGGAVDASVPPYDGGVSGLPCEVAAMVAERCASSHRTPPVGGATFPLLSLSDFRTTSAVDPSANQAQRALTRMRNGANPMPPLGYPAAHGGRAGGLQQLGELGDSGRLLWRGGRGHGGRGHGGRGHGGRGASADNVPVGHVLELRELGQLEHEPGDGLPHLPPAAGAEPRILLHGHGIRRRRTRRTVRRRPPAGAR